MRGNNYRLKLFVNLVAIMSRAVNVAVQSLSGETIVESYFHPKSTIADVTRASRTSRGISKRMQTLMCGSLTPDDGAELISLPQPPKWHVIAELVPSGLHPREVLFQLVVRIRPCAHCRMRTPAAKHCSSCFRVVYCNTACQCLAWRAGHKNICNARPTTEPCRPSE